MPKLQLIIGLTVLTLSCVYSNPLIKPTASKVANITFVEPRRLSDAISHDPRIIAGNPAGPGQFPYQAAVIFDTNDGTFFCGGALLNEQWILTAAHCASGATWFTILLGGTIVNGDEDGKISVPVTAYVVHQDYDTSNLHNDIAMLLLAQPVGYTDRIGPVNLPPDGEYIGEGFPLMVSGYGATSDDSGVSNNLNFAGVQAVSNDYCRSIFGDGIWDGQICTQGYPIQGTCGGDSGGPLVRVDDGDVRTHVGVVSFVAAGACASELPAGYTRTSYYRQWIRDVSGL